MTAITGYRWTPNRKAAVVRQITDGSLSDAAACSLFDLSADELAGWISHYRRYGAAGLSTTKAAAFRRGERIN